MNESKKNSTIIKVGSRRSELALIQTNHVISLLKEVHPEKEFEIVTMCTMGDKILDIPLPKIGEKSLFTKELETALATGCVDFVVHSLKDLPTTLPENMAIGAVLTREDPRDALVLRKDCSGCDLDTLPKDSVIGTSSLRRAAQINKKYPHLKVENIRGNLNTRLKKLDELDKYHGIVLAVAGLHRMGWKDRISKLIPCEDILYAVGQGALAVECRENDEEILELLKPIYDVPTALRIIAERTFLCTLGGGCSAPVAITSKLKEQKDNSTFNLSLSGGVWSLDGSEELKESNSCKLYMNNVQIECENCPKSKNENSCKEGDIECLQTCKNMCKRNLYNDTQCPYQPKKKLKVSENDKNGSVSTSSDTDVGKNDHCPVHLTVGADFMGKCPYLDGEMTGKCPVNGKIMGKAMDVTKCPFLKDGKLVDVVTVKENNIIEGEEQIVKSNLFCGLVSYPGVNIKVFRQAEELGRTLAESLIEKGASKIMAKAQSYIRGN
ncbi:porphobilinogen deaminase [Onthophagus taurus]|uniref:porphobilinogen deaminase n=1 Tax=Onthophagus taurus TaxID=166361 RepID=UPI0039BE04BE